MAKAVTFNFPEARLLAARLLPYMRQKTISMIPVPRKGVQGIAVDSSMRCYYDPDTLNELGIEEASAQLLHEVMRTYLNHAKRATKFLGQGATKKELARWRKASSMVVNQIMAEAKIPVPKDAVTIEQFGFQKNLLPEEYCVLLEETEPPEPPGGGGGEGPGQGQGQGRGQGQRDNDGSGEGDQDSDDGGEGTGQGGGGSCGDDKQKPWEDDKDTNPGLDEHEQEILRRITAKECDEYEKGKGRGSMPGYLRRASREILKPKVDPVRELLAQVKFAVACTNGHGDYTWKKLNRRTPPGGVRLPAHVQPIPKIMVVVDTSGSMGQKDLALALGVISQVLKALPNEGVTVVTGDTRVAAVGKYFKADQVQMAGGGGTDMAHVLTQAANLERPPDAIIIATDGETGWPKEALRPRVVAAVTRANNQYPVPAWIKVVELNPKDED